MKKVPCIIIPIFVVLFTVSIFLLSCETTGTEDTSGQVGTSITWLGTLSEHPSSPELNYAYSNTTDGYIYNWDGDNWEFLVPPATVTYVPNTGQTALYTTGDDGDLEKGVAWPNPRFTDNGDGTVTDNLTELIWLKNANRPNSTQTWANAFTVCNNLADDGGNLTDSSVVGDWRLPNVKELESLINYGFYDPAIPNTAGTGQWSSGDPFTAVQSNYYWASTINASITSDAFTVYLVDGRISTPTKTNNYYMWPMRRGK